MKILEVNDVSKSFAEFNLEDVSFSLPKGYIMGFVGPNGAGKTTTIKLILGIARKDKGEVKIFDSLTPANHDIGVVMDLPCWPDEWTLADTEQAFQPFYADWNSARYNECLKKFELSPTKKVNELSRGMSVKLQIAVALSHNAKLLILDEPTSGLDPVARDEVCEMLQEFVSDGEKSVLFSTHITSDLEKIADYITMILRGKIKFTGTKDELVEAYRRVTGGINDIGEGLQQKIIGYRSHRTGFEGLIVSSDKGLMPESVIIEEPSLDEIIIFMNKEAKKNDGIE